MQSKWLIPCNIAYFDVIAHFKENSKVVWKNISNANPGDIVYIYLGQPHKEIRYKCIVLNSDVDNETLKKNSYAIPHRPLSPLCQIKISFMELELINEYPEGTFVLKGLRENGLGQVQVQARINKQLQQYIDEKCRALGAVYW